MYIKPEAKRLAKLLFEAFERDGWGMIEPDLFDDVASGEAEENEDSGHLARLLESVAAKL